MMPWTLFVGLYAMLKSALAWPLTSKNLCCQMSVMQPWRTATKKTRESVLFDKCYPSSDSRACRDCFDLIFPILPNLAIYLLENVDVDNDENRESTHSQQLVNVSVGTECAIDVHLRNAMLLNSYPERLYFSSLRLTTLTLSAYNEFRWIQEHQDYSRLKQRCRQKFLQTQVTKTLVIKGVITLLDLTDEVELIGDSPVGFGSFSDVWKGSWSDRIEQKKKLVC